MTTAKTPAQRFTRNASDYLSDSPLISVIAWLLLIGLLTGLITVALINLKPYMVLTRGLGIDWLFGIPGVGAWIKGISGGFAIIGAMLIWAPVQIAQCLWLIIGFDFQAQKSAVRQSIAISEDLNQLGDTPAARRAIKTASRVPFQFVRWAALLALAGYSFDLTVGLNMYPVWKDWTAFGLWSKSFNPIWINGDNARDLAIMLFSFESVLVLVLIVAQWVWHRRRA